MDHNQTVQPSSHLLLTAVSAPGDVEMPLILMGSSGHLDFPSLLGITPCPALCCSSRFPLPLLNHPPMPGGSEQFSNKCWSLIDLACISVNRRHLVLATFSSLCCISERGCYARIHAFSFPQTTCYPSALPVMYRAFICIISPLWHTPSPSRALYIVTGNCVFVMAARGTLVTSSILLFLPQGMESWWVV